MALEYSVCLDVDCTRLFPLFIGFQSSFWCRISLQVAWEVGGCSADGQRRRLCLAGLGKREAMGVAGKKHVDDM